MRLSAVGMLATLASRLSMLLGIAAALTFTVRATLRVGLTAVRMLTAFTSRFSCFLGSKLVRLPLLVGSASTFAGDLTLLIAVHRAKSAIGSVFLSHRNNLSSLKFLRDRTRS